MVNAVLGPGLTTLAGGAKQKQKIKIQVPKIRRWLSYLWEQRLETASSEHNEYLAVTLVDGRLQLVAEDAIYSFGDYYLNFRKVFEATDFSLLPAHAEVLILGLGLGSIIDLLERHLGLAYNYVAVEIDPVIIELASRYSLPEFQSPIELREADAETFLQLDARQYDLICVDVFQDATVPAHLDSKNFLNLVSQALAPNGLLIYNRLACNAATRTKARAYYDTVFQPAFPAPHLFDTGGNYMLLNDKKYINT